MALSGRLVFGLIGVFPVAAISIIAGLNASFIRKEINQNLQAHSEYKNLAFVEGLVKLEKKEDYEQWCREVGQDLTSEESTSEKRIKLIACPIPNNLSKGADFYLYDLENIPTEGVKKFSQSSSDGSKISFTLLDERTKTLSAHSLDLARLSEIVLKEKCTINWTDNNEEGSKNMTCQDNQKKSQTKWLKVLSTSKSASVDLD